ncbi:MAG: phenylalanine--tRNA ligase subunit alpha, partial [Xanthomonadales bacterium]
MNAVNEIQQRALAAIEVSGNLQELDDLRVQYLGKKGEITAQLKTLGSLEPEQRRSFGQAVNAARDALNREITARRQTLEASALEQKLRSERADVTLPGRGEQGGGLHPVTRVMERAIGIFNKLGFE